MGKFNLILVLLTIAGIFIQESMQTYCGLPSCFKPPIIKGEHSMCKYPNPGLAAACGDLSKAEEGMTAEEIADIIKVHNEQRVYIASGAEDRGNPGPQPGATKMGDLSWDNELAMIAQRWASQCQPHHDQCHDVGRYEVGQNVAYISKSNEFENNMTDIILKQWYSEVDKFNNQWAYNLPEVSIQIYHYTQMVWGNTEQIGCGAVRYRDPADDWYVTRLVCNYGPIGNVEGQPLYEMN